MKSSVKTPSGRVLSTEYTPFSLFVGLNLSIGMGMNFPEKLDPQSARVLARALDANADAAEAARKSAGVAL